MIKKLTFILGLLFTQCNHGQFWKYHELKALIKENKIELNNPNQIEGFTRYIDCDSNFAYKKTIKDTIVFYTWSIEIAQTIDEFKKTIKDSTFNKFIYPEYVQDNGTVVVVYLEKKEFIYRNDTLYLLDTFNDELSKAGGKLFKELTKRNTPTDSFEYYYNNLKKQYTDFKPRFKTVYFKGIFDKGDKYSFPSNLNFREETVLLEETWIQDGTKCFKIHLTPTHDSGIYTFSEDMKFIDYENCEIKK